MVPILAQSSRVVLDPASAASALYRGRCALAIIAKAPRAGLSKTRLCPPLTPQEAAELSRCFIRDTTASFAEVKRGVPAAQGVAVFTPDEAAPIFDGLCPADFPLLRQRAGHFGERLFAAAEDLFAAGFSSVCLIDSDSPTMPPGALAAAVEILNGPEDRVVLGPSEDGGYYMIGLNRSHRALFDNIAWSTGEVFAQTCERAGEIGVPVEVLPTWYDVDDAASLAALCREFFTEDGSVPRGFAAPHSREFLSAIIAAEGRARLWPE